MCIEGTTAGKTTKQYQNKHRFVMAALALTAKYRSREGHRIACYLCTRGTTNSGHATYDAHLVCCMCRRPICTWHSCSKSWEPPLDRACILCRPQPVVDSAMLLLSKSLELTPFRAQLDGAGAIRRCLDKLRTEFMLFMQNDARANAHTTDSKQITELEHRLEKANRTCCLLQLQLHHGMPAALASLIMEYYQEATNNAAEEAKMI